MKREIAEIAKNEKISEVGFCSAEEYIKKAKGLPREASFCSSQDAEKLLEDAKTVIVCAFSYYSGAEKGNISRYAWGLDYHKVAVEKMSSIVELLNKKGYSGAAFADNGALNERLLAKLAGIAFIGKNYMAINERLGSYFFVGYVITDCEIEPDKENNSECMGCGACRAACPLGAIGENDFCEERCLSYITQKKGELSREESTALRECGTIWGCDICQEVCPHNKNLPQTGIDEFRENLITTLHIDENISNKEFKRMYGNRAFAWRGKNILIRNQKIVYNKEEKTHV
ncbi:MAG: DUF1730 domain-containing protein [Clostridia bacterium]|nr:DUF1730 domain-containing protein [Clostridia bacterium]